MFRRHPSRFTGCDLMITFRRTIRSLTATMPGWLILICGVCLAVPLVRLAALVLAAGLCLVQPARVRRAASAWKGGKSHRAFDASSGDGGPQAQTSPSASAPTYIQLNAEDTEYHTRMATSECFGRTGAKS